MKSACQNKQSCFACCGLFNLNLSDSERNLVLQRRTVVLTDRLTGGQRVQSSSNLNDSALGCFMSAAIPFDQKTARDYRKEMESEESILRRHDEEIYVCPFLGFIESGPEDVADGENQPPFQDATGQKSNSCRIGCMIHPLITNRKDSQNVGFYGASICLGYDCRNKEKDLYLRYSDLLGSTFSEADHFSYSRMMADHHFYDLMVHFPGFRKLLEEREPGLLFAFSELLAIWLMSDRRNITSFAMPHRFMRNKLQAALALCRDIRENLKKSEIDNGDSTSRFFRSPVFRRMLEAIAILYALDETGLK